MSCASNVPHMIPGSPHSFARKILAATAATAITKVHCVCTRMAPAPFRNMTAAPQEHESTVHRPIPRSIAGSGSSNGPTHQRMIPPPNRTRGRDAATEKSAETPMERLNVARTHAVSPRVMASPYAGHSGIRTIPAISGMKLKSFMETAYRATASGPRIRAATRLSEEYARAPRTWDRKKKAPIRAPPIRRASPGSARAS